MVNKIWAVFIVVGILYSVFTGKIEFLNKEILNSAKTSLDLVIQIFPVLALWLGIMNIAKVSGLLSKISNLLSPVFGKLFPDIPKGHESLSFIASNIVVNMFGLGNAATPFGLKAMESMQKLNEKKDTASRSMITFLVINTSGVTLVPTTVISMRMMYGSSSPTDIVFACMVATIITTIIAITIDRLVARRR